MFPARSHNRDLGASVDRLYRAHVLTAEGKEEKLGVVSEAMKEGWNEVPPTSVR
jgi:hypothetical protein